MITKITQQPKLTAMGLILLIVIGVVGSLGIFQLMVTIETLNAVNEATFDIHSIEIEDIRPAHISLKLNISVTNPKMTDVELDQNDLIFIYDSVEIGIIPIPRLSLESEINYFLLNTTVIAFSRQVFEPFVRDFVLEEVINIQIKGEVNIRSYALSLPVSSKASVEKNFEISGLKGLENLRILRLRVIC
ncbi:MAG: hypothetical protein ACFFBD_23465, partial [Candidatus Hodarchaeota archaeon]